MTRIVLYLVLLGVLLYVVKAIAPLVIIGVIGLVLLAWKRPDTVRRLADRPQLARMPAFTRATPMRFAATVGFAAFVLIGLSMPLGASGQTSDSPTPPKPTARVTEEASSTPTAEPTRATTREPTARATLRFTPTPEPTPAFGLEPTGPTETGTVVNIVDGDTIDVLVDGVEMRVRYIGMDTPEVHSGYEWLGAEASAANAMLVEGREVVLEKDVSETDRYGRALRYVWVHEGSTWLLVNLELIRLGFAAITTFPPDVKYVDTLYIEAQDEAQAAGRGLWGAAPTPPPTPAPTPAPQANCEPSYPGICIPIGSADLDCGDIQWRRFAVTWNVPNPDPHKFDGDGNGIGCES